MRRAWTAWTAVRSRLRALDSHDAKVPLRSVAVALWALLAAAVFLVSVNAIHPARTWLLWTVIMLWGWQLYLAAAFFAAGDLILVRLLGLRDLPSVQRVALAGPIGAMVFATGMWLGGFLALFGPVFAVALPGAMLAAGAIFGRSGWRDVWRGAGTTAGDGAASARAGGGRLLTALAVTFGVLGLGVLYLGVFTPDAVNYDSAWWHLVVAQDYAREGRIVPFLANWPANLPHLASLFFTWGFLVPGLGPPPVRWMMALHTEFAFLLWTLVGVAAAVRWFAERRARGSWAVFFLLPGIFVYDNNMGGAADHVLALFAAPVVIAAARGAQTLEPRWWAIYGIAAAGALMTKFQSAYLLVPPGLLLLAGLARGTWQRVRHDRRVRQAAHAGRESEGGGGAAVPLTGPAASPVTPPDLRRLVRAPLAAFACLAVLTAPHFIRNWVFYRNPVFPLAQGVFTGSRPTIPDAALLVNNIIAHWGIGPPRDMPWLPRLGKALEHWVFFSVRPRTGFTGNVPVVGSLFTMCIPLVLLVRPPARRLRTVALLAAGSLFFWTWTYWVDRNLQTFMPVLAIATGAIIVRVWELGRLARAGVVALIAAQLAWSGDHFLNGSDRIGSSLSLIRSSYDGRAASRFRDYRAAYVDLGRSLPPKARVLLHDIHGSLGIDREVLLDWQGFQGLFDPGAFRTPRELWDRYKALGVTHVVFQPGLHASPVKQDEVIFAAFRARYEAGARVFGPFRVFDLPKAPPPVEPPYKVLVSGIGGYEDGIYRVEDLANWEGMPPHLQKRFSPVARFAAGQVATQVDGVSAALVGTGAALEPDAHARLQTQFRQIVGYAAFQVYVRN